jgi:ribosomal-protein-serine acetyltransferase
MCSFDDPITLDSNIHIRLFKQTDAEELYKVTTANRDHLYQFMSWMDELHTLCDFENHLKTAEERAAQKTGFKIGVWRDGTLIGCVEVVGIEYKHKFGQVGYWLAHDCTGKGIMTLVLRRVISILFGEFEWNRVEIRVASENEKSLKIPERLGLRQEGTLRQVQYLHGKFIDHVLFSVLRQEW